MGETPSLHAVETFESKVMTAEQIALMAKIKHDAAILFDSIDKVISVTESPQSFSLCNRAHHQLEITVMLAVKALSRA